MIPEKVNCGSSFQIEKGEPQDAFLTEKVNCGSRKGELQDTQNLKEPKSKDEPPLFAATPSPSDSISTSVHPARKKTPAKKKTDLSEQAWLTRWWCFAFEQMTGCRYAFGPKGAGIIKGLLKDLGFDETFERASYYLIMPEQKRFPKGAPTLEGLRAMINQLAGKYDDDAEALAARRGIYPEEDIPFLAHWKPWEVAA